MADRRAETQAVKRYLAEAGYQAKSVNHGAGTTHGWIYVTVTGSWPYEEFVRDHEPYVKKIAKIAAGREDRRDDPDGYDRSNIMIDYSQQSSERRRPARQCAPPRQSRRMLDESYRPRKAYARALRVFVHATPDLRQQIPGLEADYKNEARRGAYSQESMIRTVERTLIDEAAYRYERDQHPFSPPLSADDRHYAAAMIVYEDIYEKNPVKLPAGKVWIEATPTAVTVKGEKSQRTARVCRCR